MAQRISEAQLELLKNCWHEGKSIPHCAMVAGVSTSTAKKYLAELIQQTVDNRLAISQLSITEFKTYIASEFSSVAGDRTELKQLFIQLQNDYKTDLTKLLAIREAYETALSLVAKPTPASIVEQNKLASIQSTIKSFASRYQCRIPGRRKSVYESWSELNLYQHLVYHIARNKLAMKHTETMAILGSLGDDETLLQAWLDEILEQE